MKALSQIMIFIVALITVYCLFQIVNLIVTVIKTRGKNSDFRFCTNTLGKFVYIGLMILLIAVSIGSIYFVILGFTKGISSYYQWAINIWAVVSIICAFQFGNIVQIGKRHMMVGRMMIDYRKMKKVDFSYHNDVSFVYGQKSYKFPTTFVDVAELRKAISRRS